MHLTLRQAEQQVAASKSTILRAIKSGRMSADRDGPEGSYKIDPSELFRVFPALTAAQRAGPEPIIQLAVEPATVARLQAEVEKFAALLEVERERLSELRTDRDSWRAQAERLALTHETRREVDHDAGRAGLFERLARAIRG